MSWSVNATGMPGKIKDTLDKQFAALEIPANAGTPGDNTIRSVEGTIRQFVENIGVEQIVTVTVSCDAVSLSLTVAAREMQPIAK